MLHLKNEYKFLNTPNMKYKTTNKVNGLVSYYCRIYS